MLNMRLRSGFDVRQFLDESSPVARKAVYELLRDMSAQGYITLDGSIVTMTARGLSVENELVVRLSDMCAQ